MRIDLSGPDGNAFAILGIVQRRLKEIGRAGDVAAFMAEATAGDYNNLLEVAQRYCPDLEFEGFISPLLSFLKFRSKIDSGKTATSRAPYHDDAFSSP